MQITHQQPPPILNLAHVKRSLYLKQTQQQLQHQQQQQHHPQLQRHSLHLAIPISSQPIQSTHSPSIRYKEPVRQNLPIQLNSLNQARFSALELNNHKFNIIKNTSASIDLNAVSNNTHNIFKHRQTPVAASSSSSLAFSQQIQNICKSLVSLPKKEDMQAVSNNNNATSISTSNNRYSHGRQGINSQHQLQEINQRESSVTAAVVAVPPSVENYFKATKISSAVFKANQKSLEAQGTIKMQLKEKTRKIQVNLQQKHSQEKNQGAHRSTQQQLQVQVEESKQPYQQQPQLVGRGKRELLKNLHASRELRKSSESQENEGSNDNSPEQSLFFGMKDSITVTKSHDDNHNNPQQQQQKDQQRGRNNVRRIIYGDSRDLSQDSLIVNQKENNNNNSLSISVDQVIRNEESEEGTEHIPQLFRKLVSPVVTGVDIHGENQNNTQGAGRVLTNSLLSSIKTHKNRTFFLQNSSNLPQSPCPQHNQLFPHNTIIPPQYCSSVALQVAMMSVNTPLKGKGKASSMEFKKISETKERIQRKFHSDNKKKAHNEFIQSFFPSLFSQENKKKMPSKFL